MVIYTSSFNSFAIESQQTRRLKYILTTHQHLANITVADLNQELVRSNSKVQSDQMAFVESMTREQVADKLGLIKVFSEGKL